MKAFSFAHKIQLIYLCSCLLNKQPTDILGLTKNKFMNQMLLLSFNRILTHLALLLSLSTFSLIFPVYLPSASSQRFWHHPSLLSYSLHPLCHQVLLFLPSNMDGIRLLLTTTTTTLACLSINLIENGPSPQSTSADSNLPDAKGAFFRAPWGRLGQEGSGLYPCPAWGKQVPQRLKNSFGDQAFFLLLIYSLEKLFHLTLYSQVTLSHSYCFTALKKSSYF